MRLSSTMFVVVGKGRRRWFYFVTGGLPLVAYQNDDILLAGYCMFWLVTAQCCYERFLCQTCELCPSKYCLSNVWDTQKHDDKAHSLLLKKLLIFGHPQVGFCNMQCFKRIAGQIASCILPSLQRLLPVSSHQMLMRCFEILYHGAKGSIEAGEFPPLWLKLSQLVQLYGWLWQEIENILIAIVFVICLSSYHYFWVHC